MAAESVTASKSSNFINETNIKNLINNVYLKKTLKNLFNEFNPKYERVYHTVLKGQSLGNIFDKYSVNKNEIELVKKSLAKKYKISNLIQLIFF